MVAPTPPLLTSQRAHLSARITWWLFCICHLSFWTPDNWKYTHVTASKKKKRINNYKNVQINPEKSLRAPISQLVGWFEECFRSFTNLLLI